MALDQTTHVGTYIMKYLAYIALIGLSACSSPMPIDYKNMSAEQIKAAVSDRDLLVICNIVSPIAQWGGGKTVYVKQDKSVATGDTSVSTDENCRVIITTAPAPRNTASSPK